MGNWNISIEGVGAHHNTDYPKDANKMAESFAVALKDAGHKVTKATFTFGGAQDLAEPNVIGVIKRYADAAPGVSIDYSLGDRVVVKTTIGEVVLTRDDVSRLYNNFPSDAK